MIDIGGDNAKEAIALCMKEMVTDDVLFDHFAHCDVMENNVFLSYIVIQFSGEGIDDFLSLHEKNRLFLFVSSYHNVLRGICISQCNYKLNLFFFLVLKLSFQTVKSLRNVTSKLIIKIFRTML